MYACMQLQERPIFATSLIVGGFNQPAVTRTLIELQGNAEKGPSQIFLWLYPSVWKV